MFAPVRVLRVDGPGLEAPVADVEDHALLGFDWSRVVGSALQQVVAHRHLLLVLQQTEHHQRLARLVARYSVEQDVRHTISFSTCSINTVGTLYFLLVDAQRILTKIGNKSSTL